MAPDDKLILYQLARVQCVRISIYINSDEACRRWRYKDSIRSLQTLFQSKLPQTEKEGIKLSKSRFFHHDFSIKFYKINKRNLLFTWEKEEDNFNMKHCHNIINPSSDLSIKVRTSLCEKGHVSGKRHRHFRFLRFRFTKGIPAASGWRVANDLSL